MKRTFTLILVILACLLGIILSIQLCSAETEFILNNCGSVLDVFGSDDGIFYVLSDCNNNYKVTEIDENFNTSEADISINVNETSYGYFDKIFYFFGKEIEYSNGEYMYCTKIYSYDCISGEQKERTINNANPHLSGTFAIDADRNYYMINNNTIEIYSSKYNHLKDITLKSNPQNLVSSRDGSSIYCTSPDGLIVISSLNEQLFDIVADKIYPLADNCFSTDRGEIYKLDGNAMIKLSNSFSESNGSVIINDCLFGNINDQLTAIYDEKKFTFGELGKNDFITAADENCGCFTQEGSSVRVKLISVDDVANKAFNSDVVTSEQSSTDSASSKENDPSSNTYIFNSQRGIISGIEPGSTVAAIKSNIKNGTVTVFDKNGAIKKNGTVGTGAMVEITSNTQNKFYILIYGELSGEGNINSNDKKLLTNHLLGKNTLEGLSNSAADVNGDGTVDLKDLAALDKYIDGDFKINQNR